MVYTIYDGPRQLENGMWYWAYAAWVDVRDQQANRGAVVVRTGTGVLHCDLANDHLANFRTDHVRLDAQGKPEAYTLSIDSQVQAATQQSVARAAGRGERGNKAVPVDLRKPRAVEGYLERVAAKRDREGQRK